MTDAEALVPGRAFPFRPSPTIGARAEAPGGRR